MAGVENHVTSAVISSPAVPPGHGVHEIYHRSPGDFDEICDRSV